MKHIYIFFLCLFFNFVLVSALSVNIPFPPTNFSLINVNNSLYWQGHTGTDGSWLTGIIGESFNATYNNLLNQNCPAGKVVNGTLANGTFICTTPTATANINDTNINVLQINSTNITALNINVSGYGFFGWLGSLTNRIKRTHVSDININGSLDFGQEIINITYNTSQAIVIGHNVSTDSGGVCIGSDSFCGTESFGMGYNVRAVADSVVIGKGSSAEERGTSIGYNTKTGTRSVAIGNGAKANGTKSTAIGELAQSLNDNQITLYDGIGLQFEVYNGYADIQANSLRTTGNISAINITAECFGNSSNCYPIQDFLTSTGGSFDNTNVCYLNNSEQIFQGNLTINGTAWVGGDLTINDLGNGYDVPNLSAGLIVKANSGGNQPSVYIEGGSWPSFVLRDSNAPYLMTGFSSEVEGQLLSFGTNYNQLWSSQMNTSWGGGYFRIDTRPDYLYQFFSIAKVDIGGGERFIYSMDDNGSVRIIQNLTVNNNISAERYFGNGSGLTSVCLSNGTNCLSSGDTWLTNYTSYYNKSQIDNNLSLYTLNTSLAIQYLINNTINAKVSDLDYSSSWNGDLTHAPSKNAVYDKIESLSTTTQYKVMNSTQKSNVTAWVNVGNGTRRVLNFSMLTDVTYEIHGRVIYQSDQIGAGVIFGWRAETAPGYVNLLSSKQITTVATASSDMFSTATLNAVDTPLPNSVGEPIADTNLIWQIDGVIKAGNDEPFALRVSKELVLGNYTIMPGSYLNYRAID
jgi:hypothetical protein